MREGRKKRRSAGRTRAGLSALKSVRGWCSRWDSDSDLGTRTGGVVLPCLECLAQESSHSAEVAECVVSGPPRSPLPNPRRPRRSLGSAVSNSHAPRLALPLPRTLLLPLSAWRLPQTVCIPPGRYRPRPFARSALHPTRVLPVRLARAALPVATLPARPCRRRSTLRAATRTSTTMPPASTSLPATITPTRTG